MRAPLLATLIFLAISAPVRADNEEDKKAPPPRGTMPDREFNDWKEVEQWIKDTAHCDDESEIINRVFHGRYGIDKTAKGKPTKELAANLRDYFVDEDKVQDSLQDHARPEDHDKITKIFNDENLRSKEDLKQAFNEVLARNNSSLDKIRAEGGIPAFHDLKSDLTTLADSPLKDAIMHGDSVAMAMMSKIDSDNAAKDYAAKGGPLGALYGAKDALAKGDTVGAMNSLNKAVSGDPGNSEVLSLRAALNDMSGDVAAAARDARAALNIDPNDARARQVLALTQGRSGTASTKTLDNAAALGTDKSGGGAAAGGGGAADWLSKVGASANNAQAAVRDARDALSMGNPQAAIAGLSKAIAANPGSAKALGARADAYNALGQFGLALKDALAGLKIEPRNVSLLLAKAAALNKLRRYAEAEAAARQALELDPNNPQAYAALSEALAGQRRNPEAIAALQSAARLDPRYAAKAKQAVQMPSDSDLTFLFPDNEAAPAQKGAAASAADRARRLRFVATASIVGGALLALGILQFFMPNIKSAWTRMTRQGPRVGSAPDAEPMPAPRRIEVMTSRGPGLLKDRYLLGEQIGAGGMGLVYEGQDVQLKRKVAIKRMRDEIRLDRRERERFVAEAKVVAGLHHPGIVDVFAIFEENDDVYLVFEFVSGKTLHEAVYGAGPMNLSKAVSVVKAGGEALDYAHSRNVIHRDLKPSNIMLSDDGRVKVMDFGIARVAKDALSRYSITNTVVGTPPYMAPEQEQGIVRRESDVYALAVCLYEMLSAKLPFNAGGQGMLMNKLRSAFVPLSGAAKGLPPGIDAVMSRAFDPDPEKRFHSAKELVSALEALALAQRG